MICPSCGATVPDNVKFCTVCGKALSPAPTTVAPPPPTYIPFNETRNPNELPDGSPYEPITTGGFIGIFFLMLIPLVNIILLLVWACGGCRKVNKTNLARALLIMMLISAVLSLFAGIILYLFFGESYAEIIETIRPLDI
jgi:hypothetical protein